jgi:hypothetical protein
VPWEKTVYRIAGVAASELAGRLGVKVDVDKAGDVLVRLPDLLFEPQSTETLEHV